MALTQVAFVQIASDIPGPFSSGAAVESVTPTGTSAMTSAASVAAQPWCRIATDTAVYVAFGAAPNATTADVRFFLPAGQTEYCRIPSGSKVAVVTV